MSHTGSTQINRNWRHLRLGFLMFDWNLKYRQTEWVLCRWLVISRAVRSCCNTLDLYKQQSSGYHTANSFALYILWLCQVAHAWISSSRLNQSESNLTRLQEYYISNNTSTLVIIHLIEEHLTSVSHINFLRKELSKHVLLVVVIFILVSRTSGEAYILKSLRWYIMVIKYY